MASRICRPPALGQLRLASIEDAPMIMELINESMSLTFRIEQLSDLVYLMWVPRSTAKLCPFPNNSVA